MNTYSREKICRRTMMSGTTFAPKVVLQLSSKSNPISMPVIGLGTGGALNDGDVVKAAIIEAMKVGYRHFDTATLYGSEHALGEAIAEALQLGLISSRDDLFITSKLWCSDNHPHLVLPTLRKSLQALKLDYLDLYLIHWPMSAKPGNSDNWPYAEEQLTPFDLKGVWEAMEECHNLGLTKSIGVSNFSCKKLQNLLSFATIPPSVNQVEMNLVWQQKNLREYCKEKGIIITAYAPLGSRGTKWGTNEVMDCEQTKQIAQAHGKTAAQVCLRWLYEQGVTFVPQSCNKGRLKENMEIFDWSLTKDDYEKISQIKQDRCFKYGPAAFPIPDIFDDET
ncbi:NAD(P)H-dependent 6'-deoxychalcone synthase-like isoform X1 [Abrus precatorius]|uniref:NAD(P)H-dependent 6'-deoxychalcone synthase-like isoform X1 n=1 Tax=Abrus precatorius TaxID=3816 RepID=A0A8B8MK55_ABRPR|nr:NAD(P)H-dependent 6'-deoxychalcone synthase-like isoform X1 [Abrus precatorius]